MNKLTLSILGLSCAILAGAAQAATKANGHYGAPMPVVKQALVGQPNTVPFSIINNLGYQCNVQLTQTGIMPNMSETVSLGGVYPRQYSYDAPYWNVNVTLSANCSPTGYPYTFTVSPSNPTVTIDPYMGQSTGHAKPIGIHMK